jgi:uncharacterized protein (TIGR02145 family)
LFFNYYFNLVKRLIAKEQDTQIMKNQLILFAIFLIFSVTSFGQRQGSAVTDIDGNVYHKVKIGSQVWMVENLKVSHYRNGDPIPNIKDSTWDHLKAGAYCNYDNDTNHSAAYGCLYNWYAVNDNRGLAPAGWHIPANAEWEELMSYLGGEALAGDQLKEKGRVHWEEPGTDATNKSGFTALPGGFLQRSGVSYGMGFIGCWWSSSGNYMTVAGSKNLPTGLNVLEWDYNYTKCGFAVRLIKN